MFWFFSLFIQIILWIHTISFLTQSPALGLHSSQLQPVLILSGSTLITPLSVFTANSLDFTSYWSFNCFQINLIECSMSLSDSQSARSTVNFIKYSISCNLLNALFSCSIQTFLFHYKTILISSFRT